MKWYWYNPFTWVPMLAAETASDYLPWNSWGGTAHLEDKKAARDKYQERILGWSDTATWGQWVDGDRLTAWNDANAAYYAANDAAHFWAKVARLWAGYAENMSSIHPDQFKKIVAAVGASTDAADTYRDNRNWVKWVGELPPEPEDVPVWLWVAGGLGLWILIRK